MKISTFTRFYGAERIHIGNHVRIDDFCILSAGAEGIRRLRSPRPIRLRGGAGRHRPGGLRVLASRHFSSSEDFSGRWMINPTVPEAFRRPKHAPVRLRRHALVGDGSLILPGVT